ncbi:MAG: HDOD domain-containing protein [Pseudomonadota bacterium]
MDQPLTTPLWDKVTADAQLVTLPAVYLRLKEVLDDPDYTVADIEDAIGSDPAVAARLLRVANSPYFGFSAQVATIARAVGLLGSQQVHDLVLATSVAQTFAAIPIDVIDMHAFWTRSVYRAIAARTLAGHCRLPERERLFVGGLLLDIGHLVMYQSIPHEARAALQRADAEQRALHQVERELLGFDFARLGGELLARWGLPQSLWEPVMQHVRPAQQLDHAVETAVLHLAAQLCALGPADGEASCQSQAQPVAWQLTGLTPDLCPELQAAVEQQLEGVMFMIFPGSKTVHTGSRLALDL